MRFQIEGLPPGMTPEEAKAIVRHAAREVEFTGSQADGFLVIIRPSRRHHNTYSGTCWSRKTVLRIGPNPTKFPFTVFKHKITFNSWGDILFYIACHELKHAEDWPHLWLDSKGCEVRANRSANLAYARCRGVSAKGDKNE
jgi:hypothetical protein